MYKIISLVNKNFSKSDFYHIDILEENVPSIEYDMVIYDIETLIDFEDIRKEIQNKNVFRIALLDEEDDKLAFKSFKTHAWIFKEKLDKFPELVKEICTKRYLEAVAI